MGMSREDTIKKLLSLDMYEVYTKMAQGGVLLNDYTPDDSSMNESMKFKDTVQDVTTIGALIMQRAISYTPVKTGALKNSIYIRSIESGIAIGYSSEYAVHVHEIGFYNHASPTKYKFLEEAAFDVALETETPYRISISYAPLEVYVNVPDMGAELISIKSQEKVNMLKARKIKVLNAYINFDRSKASENDTIYHDKMEQFFKYWKTRKYDDWWILDEWQDRNRHS